MKSGEKVFAIVFGALLLGTGIHALLFAVVDPVWGYPGGVLLAVLGGNAIYGGLADRRPWIFQIGPLP